MNLIGAKSGFHYNSSIFSLKSEILIENFIIIVSLLTFCYFNLIQKNYLSFIFQVLNLLQYKPEVTFELYNETSPLLNLVKAFLPLSPDTEK